MIAHITFTVILWWLLIANYNLDTIEQKAIKLDQCSIVQEVPAELSFLKDEWIELTECMLDNLQSSSPLYPEWSIHLSSEWFKKIWNIKYENMNRNYLTN